MLFLRVSQSYKIQKQKEICNIKEFESLTVTQLKRASRFDLHCQKKGKKNDLNKYLLVILEIHESTTSTATRVRKIVTVQYYIYRTTETLVSCNRLAGSLLRLKVTYPLPFSQLFQPVLISLSDNECYYPLFPHLIEIPVSLRTTFEH